MGEAHGSVRSTLTVYGRPIHCGSPIPDLLQTHPILTFIAVDERLRATRAPKTSKHLRNPRAFKLQQSKHRPSPNFDASNPPAMIKDEAKARLARRLRLHPFQIWRLMIFFRNHRTLMRPTRFGTGP